MVSSPSPPPQGHRDSVEIPTPLKPDPLGLESSHPFRGPVSSRNTTKPKFFPHNEEEFEAEYDNQNEEEEYGETGRITVEKMTAETTDSGNSEQGICSDSGSEEEKDYVGPFSTTIPHREELSDKDNKRHIEGTGEASSSWRRKKQKAAEEVEEGEVNDDGDGTQVS